MKLTLTAMALTIAATIAAPVAAQAGPTSPPHAAVPHGGAVTPAADPHAGHGQAPAGGSEHQASMARCHHEATDAPASGMTHHAGGMAHHAEMFAMVDADHDGSISRAEWDAHGTQMAACHTPAAAGAPAGADHSGHAGHGG